MECRILKNGKCKITGDYSNNHQAIDIQGENNQTDYVLAHSDGRVVMLKDGLSNMKGSVGDLSYGNYIKIEHQNGYYTLYAHMRNGLSVKNNQYVKKRHLCVAFLLQELIC